MRIREHDSPAAGVAFDPRTVSASTPGFSIIATRHASSISNHSRKRSAGSVSDPRSLPYSAFIATTRTAAHQLDHIAHASQSVHSSSRS
jgi:hypothetical protein